MNDDIRVLATELQFPEGPAFDDDGNLWYVEQEGGGVFCRQPDGATKRIQTGGRPGGSALCDGHLWFCDFEQNSVRRLNLETGTTETIIDSINGQPLNRPNDLIFDDHYNLLFSCPGPDDGQPGYIAVYSPNGSVEIVADGLLYPTGLSFYPDGHSLLIAETHRQRIWSGYWDAEGRSWETIRLWASVVDTPDNASLVGPHGMTVGPDGNLYATVFGAGIMQVFSAEGKFVRDIALPGQKPTNCVFDPSGNLGLIVTETERGELLSIR